MPKKEVMTSAKLLITKPHLVAWPHKAPLTIINHKPLPAMGQMLVEYSGVRGDVEVVVVLVP